MPPRRRTEQLVEEEILPPPNNIVYLQPAPTSMFVSDFLKNNYWDMMRELKKTQECSICLNEMDCKKCFTLLNCGHSFCLCCIIRCQACPLCRSHQSVAPQ